MVDPNTLEGKIEAIVGKVGQCIPSISNKTEHTLKYGIYDDIEKLKNDVLENKYNKSKEEYGIALQRLINVMSTCSKIANNVSLQSGLMAFTKDLKGFIKTNLE